MGQPANDYLPVLFMVLFGIVFAVGGLFVSWLLGQRGRQNAVKNTPTSTAVPWICRVPALPY